MLSKMKHNTKVGSRIAELVTGKLNAREVGDASAGGVVG